MPKFPVQPPFWSSDDGFASDYVSGAKHSANHSWSWFSRRTFLKAGGSVLAFQAALPRASLLFGSSTKADGSDHPCFAASNTTFPPPLEGFLAKLDPAADIFLSEQYVAEINKLLDAWSVALVGPLPQPGGIAHHLWEYVVASSLHPSEIKILRDSGPLRIQRRFFRDLETKGKEEFLANWTSYVGSLGAIEVAEFEIYAVSITSESPLRVETEMRCDLVGIVKGDVREQRVGSWVISWARRDPDQWVVERWVANPEVQSRLTGPGFNDVTASCIADGTPGMAQLSPGIDDWRTALDSASGIDVYGNHGIAVGDIDGSGFDSFYVCQPSGLPNRLYRNRGDGTFDDITEKSGTGIIDGTASALFADFQNRGKQDLLVVRTGGPLLFENMGSGRFEPRPSAFHFARPPQGTFTSVAVADYDRDGLLDIYFCVYSYYRGLNQSDFPTPYYDAQNGPPNFLFHNRGDGTFEDVTVPSGMDQNNNRYSFAAAWCDYDNNGWPDLYVANDFGRKNLYRSDGDGTFTDVAAKAGVEDYGPGMSTCWVDYDNDGLQDVYVANMWLKEGKRITADSFFLPGVDQQTRLLYQKHNAGNSLYRNTGKVAFEDKTAEAGSAMGRWSWSCAAWDFDHDGYSDLYVANGFVSGPNQFDLQSFFWRQVAQNSSSSEASSQKYQMAWNAVNELVRSDYSWSGYQRNVFYMNNHDGTFSDVSGALGLDLRDDSRAYALSDFDHDGRLEFVLKNRTAPQIRVMRNDLQGLGNSVAFRLTGRVSNRDAIGAIVTIEAGATRQTKFISAGSGFASQHTKELFFGLGDSVNPISISIRWPNGSVEKHDNIPVNHRVAIEEGGKEFTATPFARSKWRGALMPKLAIPAPPATVSTWLIEPLFGPDLTGSDLNGETRQLSRLNGQPVLLTFFRLDCGDSPKQLEQIQQSLPSLSASGFSVLAVAAASGNSAGPDRATVQDLARSLRISFPIVVADERAVGPWNILYRYLFYRRRDMSLPTSFLIDKSGAIIRLYQGFAAPQQVLGDWKSSLDAGQKQFARALPFPGPYYGEPITRNYFTYGVAYVQYGYADEAQAAFQRAVEANPKFANAWYNLGTIYVNKKMYAEARKCLNEAVRLKPDDEHAWNNLGLISGEQRNYDQALEEFRNAAHANPNYVMAVDNMMRIYRYQARPAEAQKALEELIGRAPENPDLRLGLAMALVAQDQLDNARRELETALRLRPNFPDAMNNLGGVLLRMGRTREALAQFEACARIAPDFDRPFMNSALIYNGAGQAAKARQILQDFLGRHPEDTDVRSALGKITDK